MTRLVMVPSLLRSLLFCLSVSGGERRLPTLRLWLSNSETLQPSLLAKFFAMFPDGRRCANLYGSSETMADVTYELFASAEDVEAKVCDGKLSIGVPMCNCNVYVLGDDLELLPRGEVGATHTTMLPVRRKQGLCFPVHPLLDTGPSSFSPRVSVDHISFIPISCNRNTLALCSDTLSSYCFSS